MSHKQITSKKAVLPLTYDNYVFDLYGTLVDIHTEEKRLQLWQKLALFFGYYGASYKPEELQKTYQMLVEEREKALKIALETPEMLDNIVGKPLDQGAVSYSHEASPEIAITDVFADLFARKGVEADQALVVHTGQFFRVESTEYIRVYPGTEKMLAVLREEGKRIYLLSNAQRIFTAYEMQYLGISKYFDGILISSDYQTKKPDPRFFGVLKEKYPLEESRTLFIGNDLHTDIGGARAAGFATFYVNSNISPAEDVALIETLQSQSGRDRTSPHKRAATQQVAPADYSVADFREWCIPT